MATQNKASALSTDKALAALLALQVADREERIANNPNGRSVRKTEVILAASGLSATEIVPLVGKKLPAVRQTIHRGKDS